MAIDIRGCVECVKCGKSFDYRSATEGLRWLRGWLWLSFDCPYCDNGFACMWPCVDERKTTERLADWLYGRWTWLALKIDSGSVGRAKLFGRRV